VPLLLFNPLEVPKGDRAGAGGGSTGEVLAVDEPDLECEAVI
jgi:hypothetical protein